MTKPQKIFKTNKVDTFLQKQQLKQCEKFLKIIL